MEGEFAGVVERIAGAAWIFCDRQLEEVEVLTTRLGIVREVPHEQLIGHCKALLNPGIRHRVLMAWMVPAVAVAGVDFLVVEPDSVAPIKLVPQPRRVRLPYPLNLLAPPRLQHLVQIERHAYVHVSRYERQRRVPGQIKPPWVDADLMHGHVVVHLRNLHGVVSAARVSDDDMLRVIGGVAEADHEVRLIPCDGVDAELQIRLPC